MFNLKLISLCGLLGVSQQVKAPLPNAASDTGKFPLYPSPENVNIGLQSTAYSIDSQGGYRCVRNNLIFGPPQAVATSQVTQSSIIRTFYGTMSSANGSKDVDTVCSKIDTTNSANYAVANFPSILHGTTPGTLVQGRVIIQYPGLAPSKVPTADNTIATNWARYHTNPDFILASLYQDSWQGVGNRNVEVCDQ